MSKITDGCPAEVFDFKGQNRKNDSKRISSVKKITQFAGVSEWFIPVFRWHGIRFFYKKICHG